MLNFLSQNTGKSKKALTLYGNGSKRITSEKHNITFDSLL